MVSQCTDASRAKDETAKSPWPMPESSHPLMNTHTHTYMYIFTYVYIPSVTLGEAAVLATQVMGAQAQMHM